MNIGKLEVVPLREAFRHEAYNLTSWLEANIEALSERIGMELTVLEREKSVGSFNVDLFCEDSNGYSVIIENQLERTDHDHLGKLLTYLVNLEARTAIWVTSEVRPEHERVINWLNESTGADFSFYLVQVEAVRIGDSPYAPLFTILAAPDEQTREIGETKKELAESHVLREQFWSQLLERSKERTDLTLNRSPSRDYWLSVATGRSGISYNYVILKDVARIELYIDRNDPVENKRLFDRLFTDREAIEAEFGEELDWQRLDGKRASRIAKIYTGHGSLYEQAQWSELQDILIDAMIRFDKALRRRIRKIEAT